MFQIVEKFESIRLIFKLEKVKSDTLIFRLHYKFGVWLTSLYALAQMYILLTKPMICMGSKNDELDLVTLEQFCWVHGTYLLRHPAENGSGSAYPGVRGFGQVGEEVKYQSYYVWMYFFVTQMFIVLHAPKHLWKLIENGLMRQLSNGLSGTDVIFGESDEITKRQKNLVQFLISYFGCNNRYAYGYIICEILNLIIVGLLMYSLDLITGHEFSKFGVATLGYINAPAAHRTDPMAYIFPIVAKCTFNKYGPSGSIIPYDASCVLPLNVVNEFGCVFFWYFFMTLATLGIVSLIFRVVAMLNKNFRTFRLARLAPLLPFEDVQLIVDNCSYSDWFVIIQLGACVQPIIYREVMDKLASKLRKKNVP